MARKKKLQTTGVRSFKTPSAMTPSSTLSRLATTVKVDLPGMIGAGADALVVKPASAVSQFARRLLPAKKNGAAKKVDKLAREGGVSAKKRRPRKSRLPIVVVVLLALLGSGGYYAYQSVSLPSFGVAKYFDYEKWLYKVSGGSPATGRASSYASSPTKATKQSQRLASQRAKSGAVKGKSSKSSKQQRAAVEKARKAKAPSGRVTGRSKGAAGNLQVSAQGR